MYFVNRKGEDSYTYGYSYMCNPKDGIYREDLESAKKYSI